MVAVVTAVFFFAVVAEAVALDVLEVVVRGIGYSLDVAGKARQESVRQARYLPFVMSTL